MNSSSFAASKHPMAPVQPKPLTVTLASRCIGGSGIAGAIIGAFAAWVRPLFDGPVHYEMIAAIYVALPAVCVAAVFALGRVRWLWGAFVLFVSITALMTTFFVALSLASWRLWDDMVIVTLCYWGIASVASIGMLTGLQRVRRPTAGPYCPSCAYCLIGAADDACPECGRPFTLEELGITRDTLRPDSQQP